MPFYVYVCNTCDKQFDAYLNWQSKAKIRCPECRGRARKLCPQPGIAIHAYTQVRDEREDFIMGEFGSPARKENDRKLKTGEIAPVSKKRLKHMLEMTPTPLPEVGNTWRKL